MTNTNPVLRQLDNYESVAVDAGSIMTANGTMTCLFVLGLILLLPAAMCWNWVALGYMDRVHTAVIGGLIVGFVLALITTFKPNLSPYLAPLYAFCEGLLLGGISAVLEGQFPGIVIQAVAATVITIFVMVALYQTKLIRVTEKFLAVIITATFAIFCLYLVSFISSLLGFSAISNFLWSSTPISIGLSVVFCVIAALNLIIDFERIEMFSQRMAPKYMEWYCAFGLLVTIVWLYFEILRLLSKLNRR